MTSPSALPVPEGGGARRRYARYQLAVPFDLTVFRPSSVVHLSGNTQDIGEGGLSGMISGATLPGERVELTILLPTAPQPLSMHAVVRHQADLYCGFEFLNLEHSQLEQLQQLAAYPGLRASLINETEWEPGMAPGPRGGVAVCAVCGQELPEEIPVCLTCGTPRPEVAEAAFVPEGTPAGETSPAAVPALPAARKEPVKRRGPVLDSVVSIIFVVTLAIGLMQWLQSPVDANAQPSAVTVELENVFLRPPSVTETSRAERSSASGVLTAAKSVVSAVIGGASAADQQAAVGSPGSAAAESTRPRRQAPVSNSSSSSSAPASVPASAASLPTPPLNAPAAPTALSNLLAQGSSATQSNTASAPASQAPSSSDLAGMLLQKVLPVYPAAARRQGVQGQVVLKAVIGKDGTIAELRPLQGPQQLTAAAMDAVQHWRFRPYELKGKPVEVETDIRLNFQLPNKK